MFGFGSQDTKSSWDSALKAANEARDAEHWLQAAANYETALSFDAQRDDIWVQFGHSLKEFGAFGEAVKAYRQAIKINPGHAEVYVHLAHVLKRIGSYSAAKAEFERAIALNPSDVESASELDMLEQKAKAEAEQPAHAEPLVKAEEPGYEDTTQPIFREFEVTASHFAQEGAIKAQNKKLLADIDLLKQQNAGLQQELLKQSSPAKVSRAKPNGSKVNGAASPRATSRQRQKAQ